MCTIGLAQLFFGIFLVNGLLHSINYTVQNDSLPAQVDPETPGLPRIEDTQAAFRARLSDWETCSQACMSAMNLAPMVCVLFMTARLRSVEFDPKEGRPQVWCEVLCQLCAVAIAGQVAAIIAGLFCGMDMSEVTALEQTSSRDWDGHRLAEKGWQHIAILVTRVILAVLVHFCAAGICIAILVLAPAPSHGHKHGNGQEPLAPAMICTLLMGFAYFATFLGLLLTQALSVFTAVTSTATRESRATLLRLSRLFQMAEATVKFSPMLSMLYLGVRLRALLMSGFRGSPQCWAQDAMFASTGALLVQLATAVAAGIFSKKVDVDDSGSPKATNITYLPGRFAIVSVKVGALLGLYGGIILVSLSVVLLRPESATCPSYN
mmetsp:Transcript_40952/g.61874  ORF Transcript_40952/g.61874 Transcript_40952/m.61874 type:complete len:378 (+) Transcript_40952:1-1134(+)